MSETTTTKPDEFSVLALMPEDTPGYMTQAWLDCLSWAIEFDPIMKRFQDDTGMRWRPARSGIEQMIDKATGSDVAFLGAFIAWFNVNIWGSMDGPSEEAEP